MSFWEYIVGKNRECGPTGKIAAGYIITMPLILVFLVLLSVTHMEFSGILVISGI